jgi:uncharacterized C2H2 Zn-finger protein
METAICPVGETKTGAALVGAKPTLTIRTRTAPASAGIRDESTVDTDALQPVEGKTSPAEVAIEGGQTAGAKPTQAAEARTNSTGEGARDLPTASGAPNECPRCGKRFKYPSYLQRHLSRTTSCAPIVESPSADEKKFSCPHCGRTFASYISMRRHVRQNCKVANRDEGAQKLLDRAAQRQLAAQSEEIARLTELVEQWTARPPPRSTEIMAPASRLGSGVAGAPTDESADRHD